MQLSPEDQERVFGKDKLKTAYQKKKRSLNLNRRVTRDNLTIMSEEKDDLKSIKVYKFDNTKEKWHEFALKFRVIADTRDYRGIIDGSVVPPDELAVITITAEDTGEALKEKKEKLKERLIRLGTGIWLCPLKASHSPLWRMLFQKNCRVET